MPSRVNSIAWVGLATGVGVGVALLARATQLSIGLAPDSATYIGAARSLLAGEGYALPSIAAGVWVPVVHFPPLYSALIAVLCGFGGDPFAVVRALHLVLFAANVALAGGLLIAAVPGSRWLPGVAAAAIALAPGMLWIHAVALSEPLFILIAFSSLGLLAVHLETRQLSALVAAAALAGLACLTRYVGVSLLGVGLLLLLLRDLPWRRRVGEAAAFVAISASPMAAWMLRNVLVSGTVTDRSVVFHPLGSDQLRAAFQTLGSWLQFETHAGIAAAAGIAFGFGAWQCARDRRLEISKSPALTRVLLVFVGAYLGLLVVSISFLDAGTPLNSRILSPVFVALWILALLAVSRWMRRRPSRAVASLLGLLAAALLAAYGWHSETWSRERAEQGGILYGSVAWQRSATIEVVRELPKHVQIYTNGVDAVRLLAGRPTRVIPRLLDAGTREPVPDLERRIGELRENLRTNVVVIVWFNQITWRNYLPTPAQLQQWLPISRARRLRDGSIWVYARGADRQDGG